MGSVGTNKNSVSISKGTNTPRTQSFTVPNNMVTGEKEHDEMVRKIRKILIDDDKQLKRIVLTSGPDVVDRFEKNNLDHWTIKYVDGKQPVVKFDYIMHSLKSYRAYPLKVDLEYK